MKPSQNTNTDKGMGEMIKTFNYHRKTWQETESGSDSNAKPWTNPEKEANNLKVAYNDMNNFWKYDLKENKQQWVRTKLWAQFWGK